MKLYTLTALTIIILMISLPFTIATEIINEDQLYSQDQIGEDIIINVDEYQPKVLRSSLIEEQNVNVYALLKGIPSNPTLSIGNIRNINIRATKITTQPEGKDVKLGSIRYVRPGAQNNAIRNTVYDTFSGIRTEGFTELKNINAQGIGYSQNLDYDNLGYVVIPIQKIEKENDVPEKITIQLEGNIEFDASSGLNFGPSRDILTEQSEAEWNLDKEVHRFYGGYLRVDNIDTGRNILTNPGIDTSFSLPLGLGSYQGNTYGLPSYYRGDQYADIVVYDLNGERINYQSYLADTNIAQGVDNNIGVRPGALRLRVGQTSQTLTTRTTGQSSNLFNKFQIRLENIKAQTNTISALVQTGDEFPTPIRIGQGSSISPTSTWRLKSVDETTINGLHTFTILFINNRGTISQPIVIQEKRTPTGTGEVVPGPVNSASVSCSDFLINQELSTLTAPDLDAFYQQIKNQISPDNECQLEKIEALQALSAEYTNRVRDSVGVNVAGITSKGTIALQQKTQEINALLQSINQQPNSPDNPEQKAENAPLYNALIEYKTFISGYSYLTDQEKKNDNLKEQYYDAHLKIGLIYWQLGDTLSATNALKTYLELPQDINDGNQRSIVTNLISIMESSLRYGTAQTVSLAEPNGPPTRVTITSTPSTLSQQNSGSATITVGKEKTQQYTLHKNDIINFATVYGSSYDSANYQWRITSIGDGTITIKCALTTCLTPGGKAQEIILIQGQQGIFKLNNDQNIPPGIITLTQTQVPLEAVISVIPVTEKAYSSVNFDINIPIEKRAIELPLFSATLDKEINKTAELIEKLDKVIDNVGKLHEFWSKLCLATFGVLWAKNLLSVNQGSARREINPYWKEQWSKDRNPGETFDSYLLRDDVQREYEADLENTQEIFDKIDNKAYINDAKAAIEQSKTNGLIDKSFIITDKELEESDAFLKDWYLAKEKSKQNPELYIDSFIQQDLQLQLIHQNQQVAEFSRSTTVPEEIQRYYSNGNDAKIIQADWVNNGPEYIRGWADSQRNQVLGNYLLGTADPEQDPTSTPTSYDKGVNHVYELTGAERTTENTKIIQDNLAGYASLLPTGTIETNTISRYNVQVLKTNSDTVYAYFDGKRHYQLYEPTADGKADEKKLIKQLSEYLPQEEKVPKKVCYFTNTAKDESTCTIITSQPSNAVYKPQLTQYETGERCEGLAKEISADATHYLKIEYTTGCRISNVEAWESAQANSPPGGQTDRRIGDATSVITTLQNSKDKTQRALADSLNNANKCVVSANRYLQKTPYSTLSRNDLVGINEPLLTKGVTCQGTSYRVSKSAPPDPGPSCSDFMDPSDCRILFNACDPVVCPATRCNLGGEWQVENVAQTGIIGSALLCAPNFPEVVVPVCITGIRAGLQNIKSVLEGYEQCLLTQKNEGKSVGICDRIRNVYVCEILWKEGVAIFNIKGGLISFIEKKIFGATTGGGEYSDFSTQVEQSIEGIKYFTQSYAKNVFAAYDGGSLDAIGTEICKSAIYGKTPGVGDFFDEIQKPESPPQFFAFFDEAPHTDLTQVPESEYSAYYHIYAGDNEDVTYSVFLRGVDAQGNLFTNFKFLENNKPLEKGKMADQNIDFIAPSGYNEICVSINTKRYGRIEECGFGKVTTEFSINYLTEQYAKSDAQQQISNAEQCEAQTTRLTSLDYNQQNGNIQGGINPAQAAVGTVSTGLLQTGVVRKCYGINPNVNSGLPDQWVQVGTCGQDDQGHELGTCWLYKPALNNVFQQQSSLSEVEKALGNLTKKQGEEGTLVTPYLSGDDINTKEDEAQGFLTQARIQCIAAKNPAEYTQKIAEANQNYEAARTKYQEIIDSALEETDRVSTQYKIAESWRDQYLCAITAASIIEASKEVPRASGVEPTSVETGSSGIESEETPSTLSGDQPQFNIYTKTGDDYTLLTPEQLITIPPQPLYFELAAKGKTICNDNTVITLTDSEKEELSIQPRLLTQKPYKQIDNNHECYFTFNYDFTNYKDTLSYTLMVKDQETLMLSFTVSATPLQPKLALLTPLADLAIIKPSDSSNDLLKETPNSNFAIGRNNVLPEFIIYHDTEGDLKSALSWFSDPTSEVSAHYVIDTDGKIYQQVLPDDTAYATGVTTTSGVHKTVANTNSINIEFVGFAETASGKLPVPLDYTGLASVTFKNPLTLQQIESGKTLTQALQDKYDIPNANIYSHYDITYTVNGARKTDGVRAIKDIALSLQ